LLYAITTLHVIVTQEIEAERGDEPTKRVPEITKTKLLQVLDGAFEQREFQRFISILMHAQTCKDCKVLFFEAMQLSKFHLDSELQ
jgi:hypothetical protein